MHLLGSNGYGRSRLTTGMSVIDQLNKESLPCLEIFPSLLCTVQPISTAYLNILYSEDTATTEVRGG